MVQKIIEKRDKGHKIGEIVEAPIEGEPLQSFGHRDYLTSYKKRTFIVLSIAILISILIPFLMLQFLVGDSGPLYLWLIIFLFITPYF